MPKPIAHQQAIEATKSQSRYRIGMITPSANTCLEPITTAIFSQLPQVSAHFTRIEVRSVENGEAVRRQFAVGGFLRAAQLLADAEVDVIVWNGTAGSWMGLEFDQDLCRRIEAATGIRATTSSLAMVECMRSIGISAYSLVAPFPRPTVDTMIATYGHLGFTCLGSANLPLTTTLAKDRVAPGVIFDLMREAMHAESQAIAVICTNFRGAPLCAEAEQEFAVPVLDSVTVTAWQSMRMVGLEHKVYGWGSLMERSIATSPTRLAQADEAASQRR